MHNVWATRGSTSTTFWTHFATFQCFWVHANKPTVQRILDFLESALVLCLHPLKWMLWQIALALGEERKFIRHLRIFFNNSIPVAQSLRMGHLIHMDGQSVLFCLWGKLKLVLVSICMISILPPAEIRMYALLGICSKFESRFFLARVILEFTHIFWLDISVDDSWGEVKWKISCYSHWLNLVGVEYIS